MLAVAGGKGGCGKTTTTLGLAAAVVRQRKSAITVDTDREMPNLHAMAGVTRTPGLDAIAEGWPVKLVAGTADTPADGVEVIPAATGSASPRPAVESALTRLRGEADAVLLDCPAGGGPDAVAPLRAADATVVVTTPEPACVRDAVKTAAMARELGTTVAGAVVSRANDPSANTPPEAVTRLLDCPVLGVVPEADGETGRGTDGKTGGGTVGKNVREIGGVFGTTETTRTCTNPLGDKGVRAAHDSLLSALQPKPL